MLTKATKLAIIAYITKSIGIVGYSKKLQEDVSMTQDLHRIFALAIIVSMLISLLTGCSRKNDMADETLVLRVAHFPNILHSQALVGRAEGQFQKAVGQEHPIEWHVFNAGPAVVEAFFAEEVDLGYIGPGPALNGFIKSAGDFVVIAGATDAGAILVAGKEADIADIKALDGKKIAIPQYGNTQHLSLLNLLKENGLTETTKGGTVEIVAAANPDIKTLLDSGEIDAAFVPEPWGSLLLLEVGAHLVLDYNQVFREGQYTTAVLVGRKDFIQKYPDLVESFVRAHVELTDYINGDLAHAKEVVNSEIKSITGRVLDKKVLDAAFGRLTVTYNPQKESVVDFATIAKEAGFIDTTPDFDRFFDFTFLNRVLKEKKLDEMK